MFPITLHVQFLHVMVIILALLMVILLSYIPSELQRSPTYYYRYIALLSFRGLQIEFVQHGLAGACFLS